MFVLLGKHDRPGSDWAARDDDMGGDRRAPRGDRRRRRRAV